MKKGMALLWAFFAMALANTAIAQKDTEKQDKLLTKNSSNIQLDNGKIIERKDSTKKIASTKSTINTSARKAQKVNHNGIDYYIIDGIWHTKFKKKYILRQPPKGARLNFVPEGGKTVTMGGKKYYKSNGIFYKKLKEGSYEVVRP